MVWCLLVVPNYCMVGPLAKVNKTAKAIQIFLHSTPNQTCRDRDTSNMHGTWVSSYLFWLIKEEILDCWLVFVYSLWASLTPVCGGPSECAMGAIQLFVWNQNTLGQNLSFFVFWWLRLLLILCPYQVYCVFISTSTCHKAPSRGCRPSLLFWRW